MWDDHDYGKNDGDYSNPIKIPHKQVYLDYIDEAKDSERRLRGDRYGIYDDYQILMS